MAETLPSVRPDGLPEAFYEYVRFALAEEELALPALDVSVARVVELCSAPDWDVEEVAAVLGRDQALAGHLLRLANSALYGVREPVESIPFAVARLGARAVSEVALSLMVRKEVFAFRGRHAELVRSLWQHSAVTAVFARNIGRLLRSEPESALLCGLLHDVGRPLVLRVIEDAEELLGERLDEDVVAGVLDQLHETMGKLLVQAWRLPPGVRAAVAHHHDYTQAGEHRREAMVAHLADLLARWALEPHSRAGRDLRSLPVVEELGLPPDALGGLFAGADDAVDEARALG